MGWPTLVKSDGLAGWISFCSPYANNALGLHHLMLGTTKGKMLYDRDLFFFLLVTINFLIVRKHLPTVVQFEI